MKKITVGILSASLILGVGTAAFAQSNGNGKGTANFGQMKTNMEKEHPDLSTKQLKGMYQSCHGTSGATPSENYQNMDGNNTNSMMNNL